jgi:hypothetical protein
MYRAKSRRDEVRDRRDVVRAGDADQPLEKTSPCDEHER